MLFTLSPLQHIVVNLMVELKTIIKLLHLCAIFLFSRTSNSCTLLFQILSTLLIVILIVIITLLIVITVSITFALLITYHHLRHDRVLFLNNHIALFYNHESDLDFLSQVSDFLLIPTTGLLSLKSMLSYLQHLILAYSRPICL